MGNVSYWYKKILQSFADAITYGEYEEITNSVLEEESEETLENFILEYRQNININEFYFNAGIVTNQIISETRTIGNDSFNAAMFALCNFMELIGLESEAETKMIISDVAKVVRCKDCRYYRKMYKLCGCRSDKYNVYLNENDFCSFGERI